MSRESLNSHVISYLGGKPTCREVTEAVTDYLEGSMDLFTLVRFQVHLGWCLGCRIYLRQVKQTIRTLGRLLNEPVPPAIQDELLRRFRTWAPR